MAEIEETREQAHIVWECIVKLDNILKRAKKPRVTFSSVTAADLQAVGVTRGRLIFEPAKVAELVEGLTPSAEAEIGDLYARIKKIYACVNMNYEPSSRMILDAVLLALAAIASSQKRNVIILPELRIGQEGDGVCVAHPSGRELWLSGHVDYMVVEYEDVEDNRVRLLKTREDTFDISQGRLFLVEAKRQSGGDLEVFSSIPEAVSQAIALLKSENLPEVRFCLSDGHTWMFFVLKNENETLTYYQSAPRYLSKGVLENSDLLLREIMQLVCEWLRPTKADLFTLRHQG